MNTYYRYSVEARAGLLAHFLVSVLVQQWQSSFSFVMRTHRKNLALRERLLVQAPRQGLHHIILFISYSALREATGHH
jgi:hypothetical protein